MWLQVNMYPLRRVSSSNWTHNLSVGHSLLLTVCLLCDCHRGGGVTHDCCCSVPAATTAPQPQHAVTNSSTVVPGIMPPWSYSARGPALLTPLAAFFMRQSCLQIYIFFILCFTQHYCVTRKISNWRALTHLFQNLLKTFVDTEIYHYTITRDNERQSEWKVNLSMIRNHWMSMLMLSSQTQNQTRNC